MCFKPRFLAFFAVILFTVSASAGTADKYWNFENGLDGWSAWGLPGGKTQEVVNRIASVSTDTPHQGAQCLMVRDELEDINPYVVLRQPLVIAGGGKKYVLRGWIRTGDKDHSAASITFELEVDGKYLGCMAATKIPVSEEWQEFVVIIDKLPATAKEIKLRPMVFVFALPEINDRTRKGTIYLDDLRFSEYAFSPVDLTKAANAGYKDEKADDNLGGWTDQGDNDVRNLKPGTLTHSSIPFTLLDPAKNNGKSVIALSHQGKFFVKQADISLAARFDWLYLLSTGAWASDKKPAGTLTFNYQDGTSDKTAVTCGSQVGDWWNGNADDAFALPMRDVCPMKNPVYFFIAPIRNPQPLKETKSIALEAEQGNVIWLVLGMTTASGDNTLETSIAAKRDYRQWFNFDIKNRKSPNALVDLACLLDAPAGKHGFLQSKNGHFVFADGTPGRFFGTNIHAVYTLDPTAEQAEAIADTLARYGINIVRFHLMENIFTEGPKKSYRKAFEDPKFFGRFDYFIACLKAKGIYILLDSVTGLSARSFMPGSKVPHNDLYYPHRPWAFYESTFIDAAREYMKLLLTRPSKYTGKTLLEEPAVAMVMLINEQSIFFEPGSVRNKPAEYYNRLLNNLFSDFLLKKYGSRSTLAQAWTDVSGKCDLKADEDPSKGNVRPMQLEDFKSTPPDGTARLRHKDSVEFLKVVQVKYYDSMRQYLEKLGCKVPIGGTNIVYDVPELETHLAMDYTSQNFYHEIGDISDNCTVYKWKNLPLTKVDLLSSARPTCESAVAAIKLKTLPITSTELDDMWPSEWRSSFMVSIAAVSALQDWDAMFQFCYMGGWNYDWNMADKTRIILNSTVEFNDPAIMGVFPASALIYHRRDVSPAKNVVQVVYQGQDRLLQCSGLRDAVFPFNYLPFVSRVESSINTFAAPSSVVLASSRLDFGNTGSTPLYVQYDRFIKKSTNVASRELDAAMKKAGLLKPEYGIQGDSVISDNGELTRDWKKGLITVNTSRSQGFTGFVANEWITLNDVAIRSKTSFTTIIVSSLDNAPLSKSSRMLLTAVSRAENDTDKIEYGNTVEETSGMVRGERMRLTRGKDGKVMTEIVNAEIRLKCPKVKVTPLAPDMSAAGAAYEVRTVDGVTTVSIGAKLPPSIWYLLETGN